MYSARNLIPRIISDLRAEQTQRSNLMFSELLTCPLENEACGVV